MEGISLGGKPLNSLPALQDASIDASKALKALPQLMNITMMGMDVAKLSAMAEKLNIKLPTMTNEAKNSLEDLKKLPALLAVSPSTFVLYCHYVIPQTQSAMPQPQKLHCSTESTHVAANPFPCAHQPERHAASLVCSAVSQHPRPAASFNTQSDNPLCPAPALLLCAAVSFCCIHLT
jgi:hypothetical protein